MKKSIIAVFSVSITAGTLYLGYSQLKAYLIKKLVNTWQNKSKEQNKELGKATINHLKEELDKLFIWELTWLNTYSTKAFAHAPASELSSLRAKLNDKKIFEKADLKAIDPLFSNSNQ